MLKGKLGGATNASSQHSDKYTLRRSTAALCVERGECVSQSTHMHAKRTNAEFSECEKSNDGDNDGSGNGDDGKSENWKIYLCT